ncbi:MAG: NAD(P)H-hydrate dehydratase [Bacteroidia bacterium]
MKILSSGQIAEADLFTVAHEPIASIDLMERAALAFVKRIQLFDFIHPATVFRVFCGPGNNGGDGLAIARLLSEKNYKIFIHILPSEKYSPDFELNRQRISASGAIRIAEVLAEEAGGEQTVIIDALFGTGLNKPVTGLAAEWIEWMNKSKHRVVAVDIPSGLFADSEAEKGNAVVHATHTLTFQQPKLSFFFADHAPYVGFFHVLDIGLDKGFIASLKTPYTYADGDVAKELLNPRPKFSHKGMYGHALLVAGSYGKAGAAALAVKACLRSGAGLVTALVPACAVSVLQTLAPEAMLVPDEEEKFVASPVHLDNYTVVGAGPALGLEKQTQHMLKVLIQQSGGPMVLDADALNILAENKTWLSFLPAGSILTPHPKEFERLCGKKGSSFSRFEWQKELSIKYGVYIVLKGAHTSVSCPDGQVFFNASGNPGMAKGGSGDVLTGLITGLLAQGYVPHEAAVLGVYLHGLAGDMAASHLSMEAMTAGDIISFFGEAFLSLHRAAEEETR